MNGIELQDREFVAAIRDGREPNSSLRQVIDCYRVLGALEVVEGVDGVRAGQRVGVLPAAVLAARVVVGLVADELAVAIGGERHAYLDQVRKGAALNAVQIAELLINR